jgi:leucyl-tRNA synthetase
MLSDSPPEKDLEWTDTGIKGAYKYLNRLWDLITKNLKILIKQKKNIKDFKKKEEFISAINQTIYHVTLDYENFRFNRAIARIREFTNILFENEETLKENNELFKFLLENVIKIFSPMAPHITEEMWKLLGNKNFLIESGWPVADKKYLKIENITLAVQINGKLKGTIDLPFNTNTLEIEKKALSLPKVVQIIGKKKPKRIIVVKNKVANIVI